MTRRAALVVGLALALAAAGCRRRRPTTHPIAEVTESSVDLTALRRPPPPEWPRVLVAAPGTGPALYLGPASSDPALGYLEPGVRVRLDSAPIQGRVEVLVGGDLPARGWVPLARLGQHVGTRGRIGDTVAYVAPNDVVGFVEPLGAEGFRVAARVPLRGGEVLGPFLGELPAAQLSDRPFEGDLPGLTPGDCYRLPPDQDVALYAEIGDEPALALPALDPPLEVTVLRRQAEWYGVRAGYGPYVTGYLRGDLTPCEEDPVDPEDELPVWMSRESGPLFRVAAGTRVAFNARTIARLRTGGWARALASTDTPLVDVFVAVDDSMALRGLVPQGALTRAGSFATETAGRRIRAYRERFDDCRDRLLGAHPGLSGRIEVRFTIAEGGEVQAARVTENETGVEALGACIAEAFGEIRFDPGPDGGEVTMTYPVVFDPPPAPAAPEAPEPSPEAEDD